MNIFVVLAVLAAVALVSANPLSRSHKHHHKNCGNGGSPGLDTDINEETDAIIQETTRTCMQTEKTSQDEVTRLVTGQFTNITPAGKNFMLCFLTSTRMFENGAFNIERTLEFMGPIVTVATVQTAIDTCNSLEGATESERVYNVYVCYFGVGAHF